MQAPSFFSNKSLKQTQEAVCYVNVLTSNFILFHYPGQKNWDRYARQTAGACMLEKSRTCARWRVAVPIFLVRVVLFDWRRTLLLEDVIVTNKFRASAWVACWRRGRELDCTSFVLGKRWCHAWFFQSFLVSQHKPISTSCHHLRLLQVSQISGLVIGCNYASPTVRSGAEELRFWGARLDVLIFRLRSYHVLILYSAECGGPKHWCS